MLVIAQEQEAADIVNRLRTNEDKLFSVAGVVIADRDAAGERIGGVPVVANLSDAARYICREWIDEVFLCVTQTEKTRRLVDQCCEMGVVIHTRVGAECGEEPHLAGEIAGYAVMTRRLITASALEVMIKRMMDIAGGVVGCALAAVVIATVAPMIKRASPGPALYVQERIGKNGRRFKFYKIRSMHMDADERKTELMSQNRVADGRMFKLDFDPRIIGNEVLPDGSHRSGIGALIRRTSLDEFPQFFNVLRGDMSLVGTRPPTVDEWERYELHHRARVSMKPGITGMWQVSGRSDITDFEEIIRLDTQYICHWSLALDVKILLKTVRVVLSRRGAM